MPKFTDDIMYKRGQAGERILDEIIRARGRFIPYMPVFDGGHPFDRILASKDKRTLQVLEIKTIKARNAAPEFQLTGYPDTGISIDHYFDYQHIQNSYSMNVFIAFVDAVLGKVYGNILDELSKDTMVLHRGKQISYPLIQDNFSAIGGKIIYFPLINMTDVCTLSPEQCAEIEQFANYGYSHNMKYKRGYNEWKESKE